MFTESYDAEPDCRGAGSISGFTFINFVLSAASVAANVVNSVNSNNNNNNNNNNDNNDNVNNINVANNNNAGNNVNDIQICPFPCLPQPPPVIMKKRRKRGVQQRSDQDDIRIATLILTDWIFRYENLKNHNETTSKSEQLNNDLLNKLKNLNMGSKGEHFTQLVVNRVRKYLA